MFGSWFLKTRRCLCCRLLCRVVRFVSLCCFLDNSAIWLQNNFKCSPFHKKRHKSVLGCISLNRNFFPYESPCDSLRIPTTRLRTTEINDQYVFWNSEAKLYYNTVFVYCCRTSFVFLCKYHHESSGWRLIPRTPSGQLLQTCLHADTMLLCFSLNSRPRPYFYPVRLDSVGFVCVMC